MGQNTLCGIESKVEKKIRVLAKKSEKSLNRVILDILYQNSVLDKKDKRAPANSLSKLAGGDGASMMSKTFWIRSSRNYEKMVE